MFPDFLMNCLKFGWQFRITNFIRVKVGHVHPHPVFHLECADIVEERSPAFELFQVLRHVMGKKDVPGVATIHHALGHDTAAGLDKHLG